MKAQQEDLFGAPQVKVERPEPKRRPVMTWLSARIVQRQGPNTALRLMGIPVSAHANGSQRIAAWRDEMARRMGISVREFRREVDWQVNIEGNRSLALFIWEIA